ncbi:MAG: hypothetical protein Ct9H300mP12_07070 [Acidimicrobiales bacterium]|nr:MAG: hypothetical protein Ct9H300mP12_07070 [Acidimicrobiales bacterium]
MHVQVLVGRSIRCRCGTLLGDLVLSFCLAASAEANSAIMTVTPGRSLSPQMVTRSTLTVSSPFAISA